MLTNAPVTAMIPSTDIKRSREFYENVLGLKKSEMASPEDAALYECGNGTTLYVYVRGESKAEHTLATFTVQALEQEVDELTKKGVKFEHYEMPNGIKTDEKGVATMGSLKSAWFRDPDGNILSILQIS